MCVRHDFNSQVVYNSALAFSLYRATGSARGERMGLSQAFSGHVHTHLNSQEYVRASHSPLPTSPPSPVAHGHLIPQILLLRLFPGSYLPQLLWQPQAAVMLNSFCSLFLTNTLGNRVFPSKRTVSHVR